MPNDTDPITPSVATDQPAPEELRPESEVASHLAQPQATGENQPKQRLSERLRKSTYRPSHKATFIGLAVVAVVLAVNIVIIVLVMRSQQAAYAEATQDAVTISPAVLDSLGVNRTSVGNEGSQLTVGPDSTFNGTVKVSGAVTLASQLQVNSKISATDASLAKLEAGDTSLGQLNVNGDGTISTLNLRKDLNVVGSTRLQGPVTITQLLTVNNNLNVSGSLSVGGTLSARNFQASSLISDTTLTIGGHMITRGNAPGVSAGSAVGSNGTVSISGNDASGTVAVNTGVGAGNGVLAQISFVSNYASTPHVVITPVGNGGTFYVNRSASGFSIAVIGALPPGGFAFDYIVMQ